jgi:hypothetical protein
MTPSGDLIECANCDCWFTGSSLDEVFYHATRACRREVAGSSDSVVPTQSALASRP